MEQVWTSEEKNIGEKLCKAKQENAKSWNIYWQTFSFLKFEKINLIIRIKETSVKIKKKISREKKWKKIKEIKRN